MIAGKSCPSRALDISPTELKANLDACLLTPDELSAQETWKCQHGSSFQLVKVVWKTPPLESDDLSITTLLSTVNCQLAVLKNGEHMPDKLPVTIVTGFLGAGKTTLIQHIFNSLPEHRFALIENEFAQAGVDGAALDGTSATLYELNEGCVCCTVQQDLLRILQDILEQRDDFDHILIETTGLAEPEPILRLFQQPPLSKHLTLNGLVTVIDGQHVEETLQETSTCAEQITYADLILLNKTDTLTGVDQERIIAQLRQLNPLAETIPIEKERLQFIA